MDFLKKGNISKIAVVGLGLIGGSIAMAIKKALAAYAYIIGLDLDAIVLDMARDSGVIDSDNKAELETADLVIIALPPKATLNFVRENRQYFNKNAIVTDVCGIKEEIVSRCEELLADYDCEFIGGHPMAGKEKGGFINADCSLFQNAYYLITPTENTSAEAVDKMKKYAKLLGCKDITVTTPKKHDEIIAYTSQLPHVLAGAYVLSPRCDEHEGYSAGSFRDVSRVAAVDENLWTELFLGNSQFLTAEIDLLATNLLKMSEAIKNGDEIAVREIIKQGRIRKEAKK